MDSWLLERLPCPRDRHPLDLDGKNLVCPYNHRYPVLNDVPIMLLKEVPQLRLAHDELAPRTFGVQHHAWCKIEGYAMAC